MLTLGTTSSLKFGLHKDKNGLTSTRLAAQGLRLLVGKFDGPVHSFIEDKDQAGFLFQACRCAWATDWLTAVHNSQRGGFSVGDVVFASEKICPTIDVGDDSISFDLGNGLGASRFSLSLFGARQGLAAEGDR